MDWKSKLGLAILATAAILGVLADALLRPLPLGLGACLWTVAFVGGTIALVRWQGVPLLGEGVWMLFPAAGFSFCLAWRDSPTLKALDIGLIVVCLSLSVAWSRAGRVVLAGLADYGLALAGAVYHATGGFASLSTKDIAWKEIPRGRWSKNAAAVGRGLLIAVPLLLVFGGLLISADAVFSKLVTSAFRIDPESLFLHLTVAVTATWLVAGSLKGMLLREEPDASATPLERPFLLGTAEVTTVLGTLNLLFLAFVLVQVRYFFGGDALVQAQAGLTYAVYARRGFFELVAVSALCLPLLLILHALLRRETRTAELLFRLLAGIQLALLAVIMTSAVQRMRIYQDQYGQTELRFYTMAFMVWLAVLFGLFAATVLTGRRERFAFAGMVSMMAAVLTLHLLNPDAQIVNANIARSIRTGKFDAAYNASLSADGVPVLLRAAGTLSQASQKRVKERLWARFVNSTDDWRSWNWSRQDAHTAIRAVERAEQRTVQGARP